MEESSPMEASAAAGASDSKGVLPFVGRFLLLVAVPLSCIWYPLGRLPGIGNVTAGDVVLLGLWAANAIALLLGGIRTTNAATAGIAALGVFAAALAGMGASLGGGSGPLEFMEFMKRFGLASAIPLAAALFRSRRVGVWMRGITSVLGIAMAVFALVPDLRSYLPAVALLDQTESTGFLERQAGLVTNPNDLAYSAVGLAILHSALLPSRTRLWDRVLLTITLVSCGTSLIESASRSGVLGAIGALVFLLLSRIPTRGTKIALAAGAAALAMAGLWFSATFGERLGSVYKRGLHEENVESRLEMQWICLRTSLSHPLGVGFRGIVRATSGYQKSASRGLTGSDNVFIDTLLATGFLGLLSLVAIMALGWRNAACRVGGYHLGACMLRSGIIAFLFFGTASIAPVSVFLSPLFFSLLGAGAYLDREDATAD